MENFKKELVKMLNHGLELEHAARIQYLAHAEIVNGPGAEKIIARLKEIASDEAAHEEKFRNLIGGYFGEEPSMEMAPTHKARDIKGILDINLKNEKEAIDFYKKIYALATEKKEELKYEFETVEHEIRHIIIDEEEHVVELSLLLGK
jgi:bacterioferritin (cytochrome b1)